MTPKTPSELKEQIEKQQESPAEPGHERTAEGKEVPTPKRRDFPQQSRGGQQAEQVAEEWAWCRPMHPLRWLIQGFSWVRRLWFFYRDAKTQEHKARTAVDLIADELEHNATAVRE